MLRKQIVSQSDALLDVGDRAPGQLCGVWGGASWDEEPWLTLLQAPHLQGSQQWDPQLL